MEAKDVLIAFIIGLIILVILVVFYTKGINKVGNIGEGFVNGTLEDPYAITGKATESSDTEMKGHRKVYKGELTIFIYEEEF